VLEWPVECEINEIDENDPLKISWPMRDKRKKFIAIGLGNGFIICDECA
jgi:hypothetical protein